MYLPLNEKTTIGNYFLYFLSNFVLADSEKITSKVSDYSKEFKLVFDFLNFLCKKKNIDEIFFIIYKNKDHQNKNLKKNNSNGRNIYFASKKEQNYTSPIGFYKSFLENYLEVLPFSIFKKNFLCLQGNFFKNYFQDFDFNPQNFFQVMNIDCMDLAKFSYTDYRIYAGLVFFDKKDKLYLKNKYQLYRIFSILSYFLVCVNKKENQKQLFNTLQRDIDELSAFSSILSHELKRPVGNMRTELDLLLTEKRKLNQSISIFEIEAFEYKLNYLNLLINSTLDYFRIHWFKNLHLEEVDVKSVILEIIDNLQIPNTVEVKIQDAIPKIWIPRISMMQIFENLIKNAIKYSDPMKKKCKIIIGGKINKSNQKIEFWIQDNGIGIPKNEQKNVFKLFYRINPLDKEGTGVGLSLIKKIINIYSGELILRSKIMKGSRFTFKIPL